jgi:GNAT superfamily N-acetyltransferase
MGRFELKQIDNLLQIDMNHLVKESKEEGFRIVERLVEDYKSGSNAFNKLGEVLYGVFDKEGKVVAIGGINVNPYTGEGRVGRLRRVYVSKDYRRIGVGKLLLGKLVSCAKEHFEILVLNTNTEQADRFYTAFGFKKTNRILNSTHYIAL